VDIVRRYNGLVIARSGTGKVIFDFKNNVPKISDAVVYSDKDNQLPRFSGTMISIIIPAFQNFSEKRGATRPSFKIPEKIAAKKNYYYSFLDIINDIETNHLKTNQSKPSLQILYKKLFDSLGDIFAKHKSTPSLLIFDCTGFKIFPLQHKLLYYFCTSPNVNEMTSAVLLNFNDIDIINDVRNSIAHKLTNPNETNHLYKPIPIINSETEIHWLGVANVLDEAKLTELLKYESYNIAQTDVSQSEDYKGHFFNIDKYGNITSNILTQSEIIEFVKNEK
jgi:hypothetical protein